MGQCLVKLQEAGVYVDVDGVVTRNGKVLKYFVKSNGYHSIRMSVGGVLKTHYVHRLVAMYHLNLEDHLTVNHKDSDRSNNKLENLEVVTFKRNVQLALATPVVALSNTVGYYYPSIRAAEQDGFDASTICKVLKNKVKHHRGLKWANV